MSRVESFSRMSDPNAAHGEPITRVEIPLIQRDYAQGRTGEKVDAIRTDFLEVLVSALASDGAEPVGLDFVYGELKADGTLQPLDGQQRLTTLFLLHWYLAARTDNLATATGWANFTYETRPSARRFCQRLVAATPPADAGRLSAWIQDQPWYLFVWRHDPTIASMLVMIDAIDEHFSDVDAQRAWDRLTDPGDPAISFHLLPLPDMGSAEDLYVKMNSRGKPLTDFENFKAHFEKVISWSPRAGDFAHQADTSWSDVLWRFRGEDDLVDDEFLRYFAFVTEICEWSEEHLEPGATNSITARAHRVFGADNPSREQHLDFLFTAFGVWVGRDVRAEFEQLFHTSTSDDRPAADDPSGGTVRLFFRDTNPNLFESACRSYGETTGAGNRIFTFGQTLLLLAVVLRLSTDFRATKDQFRARIRTLRNLVEGSQNEMRAERMPRLIADTRALILEGALPKPGNTFAVAQISDEHDKRKFLADYPEAEGAVTCLEDNDILKGSTTGFALDADTLATRGATFNSLMSDPSLWWDLTGALLTFGEYQWPRQRGGTLTDSDAFQFGTWHHRYSDAWREVLVGRTREDTISTAVVLAEFLDALAASPAPLRETLERMQAEWLRDREEARSFDWRYYMVKYRSMRSGASGLYYAQGRRMGFSLTNLPGGKRYRNANYRDPYLQSIFEALGEPPGIAPLWFTGYEWDPRWLRFTGSGVGVRVIPAGFEIAVPSSEEFDDTFTGAMSDLGAVATEDLEPRFAVNVAKASTDPLGPDGEDRIQAGARVVARLLAAGL